MANLLPQNEFRYWLTYEGDRIEIFAPEDWDSDSIGQFKRDEKYFGLMRTFGEEHKFVLNAFNIITTAYNKYGYEAEVIFEVEQLDRVNFNYLPLFKSDLDFSQYRNDSVRAVVKMMEFGLGAVIKAKENIKYEYKLEGTDVVNLVIPGVVFNDDAQFIPNVSLDPPTDDYVPSLNLVVNNTQSGYVTVQNTQEETDIDPATSPNWFASANRLVDPVKIQGRLIGTAVRIPLQPSNIFRFVLINNFGVERAVLGEVDALSLSVPFNIAFDVDLSLANGERLFLYIRKTDDTINYAFLSPDSELKLSYTQVSDPSNCKGISAFNLYKRIIKRIAPLQVCDSSMIKNNWSNLIITCGNAIRELENPVIQTTLSEFFDTFNALESAGMGVDTGVLRLETRPFFYRPYKIDTLTGIESCEFSVAVDMVFNSLEIGYDDGNTDDVDGQFEFNSKQEWEMPISRIQRKESWISKYRADQYGIEKLRVDFIKKTNDTSSDNDTFMFDCYYDGSYRPIKGSDYVSVSGMSSEQANQSVYNLRLSPKENLLRHSSYFASIFDKYPARYIQFASAEKNKDLVYTIAGNPNRTIKQSESVQIATFSDKYFTPTIATLQAKLPLGFMSRMNTNCFGYLEFQWQDQPYKGYILDLGVDLYKNAERQVTLLLMSNVYAADTPVKPSLPTPPQSRSLVWSNTEQAIDYIDVNLQIKEDGTIIVDEFGNNTGEVIVTENRSISVQTYCIDESQPGSQITLTVKENGINIYNDSTPAVPGAALIFPFTVKVDSDYEVISGFSV